MTPDEWGAANRVYPPTSGLPGPRDPTLTPYIIPFERAVHARTHRRAVLVISAQSGKSEAMLDIIGERMDTAPVPMLYLGPTKQFITDQWEPRIMELLDGAPVLARKVTRGRRMKKTLKHISGVPLRLAHGGSSSALKSDPFGLALTDEADELMSNVKGAGNPIDLVDIRGDTYADFVHAIVSTPTEGPSEVELDPETGLEFWSDGMAAEVSSTIWKLWLGGTRHHWAWPCPHCGDYFIPKFKNLTWEKPKSDTGKELPSDPALAKATAHIQCPICSCEIYDADKAEMNERGVYVAPGQCVTPDGVVHGEAPDNQTISFWVSGLASPFKTWGERAERYVTAVRSGDSSAIQAVVNGGFGELYTPGGGSVPEWREVQKLGENANYSLGEMPAGVKLLTMTVDVQKYGLYWVIRGWGDRGTSWLIDRGYLQGETADEGVWEALEEMLYDTYDGLPIRLALIDSGFRPGKPDELPLNRIYEFCRKHKAICKPTKGSSKPMVRPIMTTMVEVKVSGEVRGTLQLYRLETDHFKRWVHERLGWDQDQPGAWHLPNDIDEDYSRQIVSEARVKRPSNKVLWIQKAKDNHFFDCEAMQAAAGSMLNVLQLRAATAQQRPASDNAKRQQRDFDRNAEQAERDTVMWKDSDGRGEKAGSIWD